MIPLHLIHEPTAGAPSSISWRHFISMPHHIMFTLGSLQAILVMLWWLVDLGGRYGAIYAPIAWGVPSVWAHLYLMIFAVFPLYMFGFLMTTYPKWMAGNPVASRHYLTAAGLLGFGGMFFYMGLITNNTLLLVALVIHWLGWGMAIYALLYVYKNARQPDVLHARITSAVLLLGWILLLIYIVGIYRGSTAFIAWLGGSAVWWFLLPVFFAVSHRLIPFFSSAVLPNYQVIRPEWTLFAITSGAIAHGVLEILGHGAWTWLVDFPMAVVVLWLSYCWRFKQSFSVRILAMLHIAFVWLGMALILFGMQSLLQFLAVGFGLNRAPLHAMTVGYFTSMLLAMSTRVSLGHAGRPLSADRQAWWIFIGMQGVALLRVLADLPGIHLYATHLYLCSSLLWLVVFTGWAIKFIPMYFMKT